MRIYTENTRYICRRKSNANAKNGIMEERFYLCNTCHNLAILAIASGITPYCCGDDMIRYVANMPEGETDTHTPIVTRIDNRTISVRVGKSNHPRREDHCIRFICLQTDIGGIIQYIGPGEAPEAVFHCNGTPLSVYAYCNRHGLWKADVPPFVETINTNTSTIQDSIYCFC